MNNEYKHSLVFQLLTIVWVVLSYVPYATNYSPTVINIPVILGLSVLLLFSRPNTLIRALLSLFPFFIFVIIDYFTDFIVLGENKPLIIFFYSFLQQLLLPLITVSIIRRKDYLFAKTLLLSIAMCFFVTSITTYIGCTLYPEASRALAGGLAELGETDLVDLYNSLNIGGFVFIYTLVLFCPILVFMIKEMKVKLVYRLFYMLLFIWVILVIFKSEYTTAVLVSFMSLSLLFIKAKKRDFILMILLFGILLYYASDILLYFSSIVNSETLSARMEDVSRVIQGLETSSSAGYTDIDSRKEAYELGWTAFLESPLYGNGKAIGGHSFLLNVLSRYGLIGLALLIYQFVKIFSFSVKSQKKASTYYYMIFIFLMQIVLAILNPMVFYSFFMVIVPLFCFIVNKDKKIM